MMIAEDNLTEILQALDRQIRHLGGGDIRLVVCGGSALAALGLIGRTTKDDDILASVEDSGSGPIVVPLRGLPVWLVAAARRVARDFNLPADWLNLGPARQVHFKLYAAVDQNGYHTQDLLALNPTRSELRQAALWTLTQDVSTEFHDSLRDLLRNNDYEDIAEELS